ncbi:Protein p13 MTCP-1 [Myotis brandtii]|uniref:Protein p13 MTCP-1 n=1 Tax=Myotis brandtii TaxID=109478 RepID=S7MT16_MYOBR|nr:Protein p13 MTCP-1 [Myotis brandtii]
MSDISYGTIHLSFLIGEEFASVQVIELTEVAIGSENCGCCSLDHGGVMAELPSKVHLTSHPICLRRGPWVYEDEDQRTWLHHFMELGGVLQVLLHQEDIPIGHIPITQSWLTSSIMPLMWTLHPGGQYVDHMGRFWCIVHHIKVDGLEEMILELMDNS